MFDVETIMSLIEKLETSSLQYFECIHGNQTLILSKHSSHFKETAQQTSKVSSQQDLSLEIGHNPSSTSIENIENESLTDSISKNCKDIKSPIVGVAYLKPSPQDEDFVKVGTSVSKGQVVCIVETMKIMNEITSPYDGVIEEICIQNEQVVEYDQPLFVIKEGE